MVCNKIAVINAWTLSLQSQLLTVVQSIIVTSTISFPPSWSVRSWRKNNQINLKSLKEKTRLWLTFWPWGITYFMRNEKSCIQEIENQKEGVSGVNRLATKGEIYYWLPTKRDKLSTDYRHGPTLSIFVFRKRSILYRKSSKNPLENRRGAYLRGGRGGGGGGLG